MITEDGVWKYGGMHIERSAELRQGFQGEMPGMPGEDPDDSDF